MTIQWQVTISTGRSGQHVATLLNSRRIATIVLCGAVVTAHEGGAASFDCRKASTKEERLICADPMLSALDEQMAAAFKGARSKSKNPKALIDDQRDWLSTRSMCLLKGDRTAQIGCLRASTEERKVELLNLSLDGTLAPDASKPAMSNSIIGERIQGRCHMDSCRWFSIEKRTAAGRSKAGVLYRIEAKSWSSHHPEGSYETPAPLEEEGASGWYAFCSLTHPATLFEFDGAWLATFLAPGNEDGIYGYNETAYIEYFAACHDIEIPDVYESPSIGRRLGYQVSAESVGQRSLDSPEDILGN